MTLQAAAVLACRAASRYRLRTAFMMMGITIGIASLTALASVGERTKQETLKRFRNMLGTFDTIIVRPGAGTTRGMVSLVNVPPTLKFDDAEAIAALPEVGQVALVQNAFDIDVKSRDRTGSPAVFGVSSNWLGLRGDELDQGGFLSEEDDRSMARVAVLGRDVVLELFGGEDPLAKVIRIADVPFQVKGVLRARGAGPAGGSLDNVVLVPVRTASRRLFNRDYLTMVIAQLREPERSDAAIQQITFLLRRRHHIAPTALDDFTVTSPKAVLAQVTHLSSTLTTTLTGASLLATAIGGIVITTLMLIAVTERRREIGIRRSIGASRRDILAQFLLEATIASGLGGALGVTLGLLGSNLAARLQGLPPLFSWNAVGWAACLSMGAGLAFGAYPAWRAAQVRPADALRS